MRDIVDTSGTVLYHTGYDSFGNKVSSTGSGGDRFGFTGREHDAALNLYYYRARFYDPATGRFVSKDPIGFDAGDANLYRYVGNGPTNGTDPSGLIDYQYYLDVAAGGLRGVGQGIANNANAATDSMYGVYNLAASTSNAVLWTNYKIIDPPDWSYQLIGYETESGHYYSKMSASVAQAIGSSLIGNVSTPSFSVPGLNPTLIALPGGGMIASGAAIPSITLPAGQIGSGIIISGRIGDLNFGSSEPRERGVGGVGWKGDKNWRDFVNRIIKGGTIDSPIISKEEAIRILKESGCIIDRIENGHLPPNPHVYPHINYTTPNGTKGTIRITGI